MILELDSLSNVNWVIGIFAGGGRYHDLRALPSLLHTKERFLRIQKPTPQAQTKLASVGDWALGLDFRIANPFPLNYVSC